MDKHNFAAITSGLLRYRLVLVHKSVVVVLVSEPMARFDQLKTRSACYELLVGPLICALAFLGACSAKEKLASDGGLAGHEGTKVDASQSPHMDPKPSSGADGGLSQRDAGPVSLPGVDGGLQAATYGDGELDPASHGGTLTFQNIGATGWYPSLRDPTAGPCDAYDNGMCCMARHEVTSDQLTPWNQDLILTLRGPINAKQLAVYQPQGGAASAWALVSSWDSRNPSGAHGMAFHGNDTETAGFDGEVGTECLVDVSTDEAFPCGAGSTPFCSSSDARYYGWSDSKLIIILATMPHADELGVGTPCSTGTDGNWYDAPWLGLSLGELVRAGAFSSCQCYAKNPDEWWLGDGCGQFNVFEVVNDNNQYRNLEVFSTNFFGYAGYVGEGPCGQGCDVSGLEPEVDLINKSTDQEATQGAVASPSMGPGAAFRRPTHGYRYFLIHLDVPSRTVQLAIVHPSAIPSEIAPLLPGLPATVSQSTVDALLDLRLPQ